jgi:transcriptional regulator with XRE-family HTH domain
MVGETEQRERFAYALQQAMDARKLSARQLGKDLGIDARRVARWLQARDLPNIYEFEALVGLLRVREELFRNPPPVPVAPAYPIGEYLLGSADVVVDQAVAAGQDEGRQRARQPLAAEAPSGPAPLPPRRSVSGGR